MRIGIDIDGILNNQYTFCLEYGSKFCKEIGKYKIENPNALDTTDMFLWGENTAHQFWNKYREELVIKLPAKTFASEVIQMLKKEKNEIYIITARKNIDEWYPKDMQGKVEEITKSCLKENHIFYDKIFFDVQEKGEFCKNNQVDIMIDDDPNNIKKLIGKTKVIILDYPYNRNNDFQNVIRAYSWYDIYNKIKNM